MKSIWTKLFSMSLLFMASFSVANAQTNPPASINSMNHVKLTILPHFNSVIAHGNISLQIIGGQTSQTVTATGSQQSLNELQAQVQNNTLILSFNNDHNMHRQDSAVVTIKTPCIAAIYHDGVGSIHAQQLSSNALSVTRKNSGNLVVTGNNINLTSLTYLGSGDISVQNLLTHGTTLNLRGDGRIRLSGKIFVSHIDYQGQGGLTISQMTSSRLFLVLHGHSNLCLTGTIPLRNLLYRGDGGHVVMYWIHSRHVSIEAHGKGYIQLAGVAGAFHTDLYDDAHVDARYLRADLGYIETADNAEADVWVHGNLNAIAKDTSNIYYFTPPDFLTTNNKLSGNVLAMHNIPGAMLHLNPANWLTCRGKC